MLNSDTIQRSPDLVYAEVDGEAVALSAVHGACYGLNGVGLRVLQLMDSPITIDALVGRLTGEYEVDAATCETQVMELLADLEAEGLVKVEPQAG